MDDQKFLSPRSRPRWRSPRENLLAKNPSFRISRSRPTSSPVPKIRARWCPKRQTVKAGGDKCDVLKFRRNLKSESRAVTVFRERATFPKYRGKCAENALARDRAAASREARLIIAKETEPGVDTPKREHIVAPKERGPNGSTRFEEFREYYYVGEIYRAHDGSWEAKVSHIQNAKLPLTWI